MVGTGMKPTRSCMQAAGTGMKLENWGETSDEPRWSWQGTIWKWWTGMKPARNRMQMAGTRMKPAVAVHEQQEPGWNQQWKWQTRGCLARTAYENNENGKKCGRGGDKAIEKPWDEWQDKRQDKWREVVWWLNECVEGSWVQRERVWVFEVL